MEMHVSAPSHWLRIKYLLMTMLRNNDRGKNKIEDGEYRMGGRKLTLLRRCAGFAMHSGNVGCLEPAIPNATLQVEL